MKTGVCYYPEHWPRSRWATDARQMVDSGLSVVRIGEFAWSRLEPDPGRLEFDWLADALDVLHSAGLEIVLGTPTATPPRWMLDRHPDMIALDPEGRPRHFGSRRHYCFSYRPYWLECERIVTRLAERFGEHPGVVAWQTDNEYGCHDTVLSYSAAALHGFRHWCREQYDDIDTLNRAWGNVFWSMDYRDFDDIGFPIGAVTETSPAHRLAFWRYSSEQVAHFNRVQVDILRRLSPGRDLVHNYMGNFVEFDHYAVARDLDVASWDNYPLGFLTRDGYDRDTQTRYLRTGHPDGSAFHHDLYRGCAGAGSTPERPVNRLWVMELQPGPVNWAPFNPAPLPGMLRLWTWEAIAHGAELVSVFRWRQAPFAQEQMHTGLLRSDGEPDLGLAEIQQVARERDALAGLDLAPRRAAVALVFDYEGDRVQRIQQPDGRTYDPLRHTQRVYGACRRLGIDVDVVSPWASLDGYRLVLLPLASVSDIDFAARLAGFDGEIVLFPRTGSKTHDYCIPDSLPPGAFDRLIDIKVVRVETLPDFVSVAAHPADEEASALATPEVGKPEATGAGPLVAIDWREWIETSLEPEYRCDDGVGLYYRHGRVHYLNACLDEPSLLRFLHARLDAIDLEPVDLGPDLRLRRLGEVRFAFNYGPDTISLPEALAGRYSFPDRDDLLIGDTTIAAGELAAWRVLGTGEDSTDR